MVYESGLESIKEVFVRYERHESQQSRFGCLFATSSRVINEHCGQMDRRAKQRNAYCSNFGAAYERRKVLDGTDLLYGRLCLWLRIHVSRPFH